MQKLVAVLILLAGVSAKAAELTVDEIVARYIDARGGIARMQSIQSIIYHGVYREGEHVSPHAAMSLMRPYYKLDGDAEHPSSDFAEGYDGSTWEFYGDPGVVLRTCGAASAAGRHATSIDGPLIGWRERGWTVTLIGRDAVNGRPAYRLLVHMPDGFEQEELIDADSWLLVAERKAAPIHAFGEKVQSEERIGDYRRVEGVLFPFSHREVEIATGKVLNEMQWTSITANRPLDPSLFSPPAYVRTPLQKVLEQMYEERTDIEAVMWTYRDFRAAHKNIDTHAGVEFDAYQMLKMGDTGTAVRLLEANRADYPGAASASFGLGRAYRAAGRQDDARSEFNRALTIDPAYRRAKEALELMRSK